VAVARGLFTEHSYRLSRVIQAVPSLLSCSANRFEQLTSCEDFARAFRKGGDYVFGISINIATGAMEELYERLCWIYITVKNTLVDDHVGNTYHLSELTKISEGRIPYPEQFAYKLHYGQKSLLQDLRMKDVLRTKWIKQGKESLQQVVSIFREESLLQIVSGIYDPNAIVKNLSEQDICFDSKDLIDSERNAVDLNDQRDSKGQISFTSFKIWNIWTKYLCLYMCNCTRYQQFSNFSGMQSSFETCL
jgi:hypothetical protein